MTKLIATSEIGDFLDAGRFFDFANSFNPIHSELLTEFSYLLEFGTMNVTSLAATEIIFSGTTPGGTFFEITVEGSGITPVSSFADLLAAFESGLADGSFSKITVEGSKAPATPVDVLVIDISPAGYTLTSGNQVIDVGGAVLTDLGQLTTFFEAFEQLMVFDTLTDPQKDAIIAEFNAYAFSSFSYSSDGTEVFALNSSATETSVTLLGYTMTLFGDFPVDFGDVVAFMFEVVDAIDSGAPIDFSNLAGYSIDQLKIFNADGEVILKTVGDLGDSDTLEFHVTKIDGVNVANLILGDNTENSVWPDLNVQGDNLIGTDGKDHMFGLAGNDWLIGGKGNDFLYGGTGADFLEGGNGDDVLNGGAGNDRLYGGNGNDVLNAGSNKSVDFIYGSKGNDTMIFSDSAEGYQVVDYADLNRGIKVVINGKTNTGEITKKGGLGTDTLVDVDVPIKAGGIYATGGFSVGGTAKSDEFFVTNAKDGWISVYGGDGADAYVLKLTKGSITRLENWGVTNGLDVDLSSGTIIDDGFGNTETINIIDKGGMFEIRGTRFVDNIVGSDRGEQFILEGGDDYADGGDGVDLIRYDRFGVGPVDVNLANQTATGTWGGVSFSDTLINFENIRGSRDGDDTLTGNAMGNRIEGRGGDDTIKGLAGRDKLYGEEGKDKLIGGSGRDILVGGADNDKLTGGGQKDVFVYNGTLDEGRDLITDFQDNLDLIEIAGEVFGNLNISSTGPGGANTLIELDSGTKIVLKNIDVADITIDDFVFV